MAKKKDVDGHTGTETTGHEWDGVKELNTPLPRWWLWIFYATIVWAIGYWIAMPAWPLLTDYTRGYFNHSQRADVIAAVEELKASRMESASKLANWSPASGAKSPELLDFALSMGKAAFGDNCATCHGAGAQGSAGYPNLNDDVWLWGGTIADIERTLTVGIRSTHPDTRSKEPSDQMPAFGRNALLTNDQIEDLTNFVLNLSGQKADAAAVERARQNYADQCAVCHGADGKGDRSRGAPNLTDKEWLYGGTADAIRNQIVNGRGGVMPKWEARLDPVTIKALAVYVHSLGGGEPGGQ
jgi:cytochrome c oxidase cbb3-type subunit III